MADDASLASHSWNASLQISQEGSHNNPCDNGTHLDISIRTCGYLNMDTDCYV